MTEDSGYTIYEIATPATIQFHSLGGMHSILAPKTPHTLVGLIIDAYAQMCYNLASAKKQELKMAKPIVSI